MFKSKTGLAISGIKTGQRNVSVRKPWTGPM